ncbi:hypothetical protein HRR83_002747 [Exophiala dermatitidis]
MLALVVLFIVLSACLGSANAIVDPPPSNDLRSGSDLWSFVSRPDIRAPVFKVIKHQPKLINPGHWFVAPYTTWDTVPERTEYQPFQVGPHIYDGDGNLVWSGAALSNNRNAFDFRTFEAHGTTFLSYILHYSERKDDEEPHGLGVFLDSSFRRQGKITHDIGHEFNIHELDIRENGTKALFLTTDRPEREDIYSHEKGWFAHDCINEMDLATNTTDFQWCPLDHGVSLNESYHEYPDLSKLTSGSPWDFFHGNSIDKFNNGDFLLSSRHTNTIYRVRRSDQSIAWRLGGKLSDFSMDFNFSSQHHATIYSEGEKTVTIAFLDNASDDQHRQANSSTVSSAKLVALDSETMEAKVLQEWWRPDSALSDKRGSTHFLPNGNVLIGWSERGYMTEHTMDNQLVLEAAFVSSRFSTYRSYKSNFTGFPTEAPALESFIVQSQSDPVYSMTTSYISWNGATEVHAWSFYGSNNDTAETFQFLGQTRRSGFETAFSEKGAWKFVYAEAIAANGSAIGKSAIRPARFLPGSTSLKAFDEMEKQKASLLSSIASQTNARLRRLDKAAIASGAIFILLGIQLSLVLLYLMCKRSRRMRFGSWPAVDEDQVQLLSRKAMID